MAKRELYLNNFPDALCLSVLWLFLTVPWVGLQPVIVVFPDHAHLLFGGEIMPCALPLKSKIRLHLLSWENYAMCIVI